MVNSQLLLQVFFSYFRHFFHCLLDQGPNPEDDVGGHNVHRTVSKKARPVTLKKHEVKWFTLNEQQNLN